jgi:hypothetical protein
MIPETKPSRPGAKPTTDRRYIMTKYYRSVNGKPVEITEQEAAAQEQKNKELFESGDFQKMLEIEIILKIDK